MRRRPPALLSRALPVEPFALKLSFEFLPLEPATFELALDIASFQLAALKIAPLQQAVDLQPFDLLAVQAQGGLRAAGR